MNGDGILSGPTSPFIAITRIIQQTTMWLLKEWHSRSCDAAPIKLDDSILSPKSPIFSRAKIEELETNSKIKNIRDLYRGINDFKKDYQPRCSIVKDEKGDLVADSHSIVARWRNYFSQLFNMHEFKDAGQVEIPTAEPLVPEPSAFGYR